MSDPTKVRTAWLIEDFPQSENAGVLWLALDYRDPNGFSWSANSDVALQFARERDAHSFAILNLLSGTFAVREHAFYE